jgi:putative ABC transport system permease protein
VSVRLELGPILRSLSRQKVTFALLVLQLASTFTIVSCLVVASSWYLSVGYTPRGYDDSELIGVTVRTPATGGEAESRAAEEERRLTAVPGVLAVASIVPSLRSIARFPTLFFAAEAGASDRREILGWSAYTTSTVATVLGLRFVEGGVTATNARGDAIVLTRSLGESLFPRASALGRVVASDDGPPARVIAVVEDLSVGQPFAPRVSSVALRFGAAPGQRASEWVVRARPGMRAAVARALTATLGPGGPERFVAVVLLAGDPPRQESLSRGLVTVLGTVGLMVALMGLIGTLAVASYLVAERRRHIGIRRALGATRWDIIRYFLVESAVAAALGTGLGVALTLGLVFTTRSIFPTLAVDWRHLAATAVLLWLNATAAAMLPARRAARIPPSMASRGQ